MDCPRRIAFDLTCQWHARGADPGKKCASRRVGHTTSGVEQPTKDRHQCRFLATLQSPRLQRRNTSRKQMRCVAGFGLAYKSECACGLSQRMSPHQHLHSQTRGACTTFLPEPNGRCLPSHPLRAQTSTSTAGANASTTTHARDILNQDPFWDLTLVRATAKTIADTLNGSIVHTPIQSRAAERDSAKHLLPSAMQTADEHA